MKWAQFMLPVRSVDCHTDLIQKVKIDLLKMFIRRQVQTFLVDV